MILLAITVFFSGVVQNTRFLISFGIKITNVLILNGRRHGRSTKVLSSAIFTYYLESRQAGIIIQVTMMAVMIH